MIRLAFFESEYWHPSVATDAVILSLRNDTLSVLLAKRADGLGWALPGGFIQKGESLDECVRRELKEETGIEVPFLRHFGNYSAPERDPRGQVISIAYVAVYPSGKLKLRADTDVVDVGWFNTQKMPDLAFDHSNICSDAIAYTERLIEHDPSIAFAFLPDEFTLTELQSIFEALGGEKFAPKNKRNFRMWVNRFFNGAGMVVKTGGVRTGSHRPAFLYKPNPNIFRGQ